LYLNANSSGLRLEHQLGLLPFHRQWLRIVVKINSFLCICLSLYMDILLTSSKQRTALIVAFWLYANVACISIWTIVIKHRNDWYLIFTSVNYSIWWIKLLFFQVNIRDCEIMQYLELCQNIYYQIKRECCLYIDMHTQTTLKLGYSSLAAGLQCSWKRHRGSVERQKFVNKWKIN